VNASSEENEEKNLCIKNSLRGKGEDSTGNLSLPIWRRKEEFGYDGSLAEIRRFLRWEFGK
jgi:hypothetical protein